MSTDKHECHCSGRCLSPRTSRAESDLDRHGAVCVKTECSPCFLLLFVAP